MKNNLIVMVVLLFLGNTTIAQKSRKNRTARKSDTSERVKIYMENGSIYNGILISETSDSITLSAFTDNIVTIARDDADRILDADEAIVFPDGKYHDTHGFFWGLAFSLNPLTISPVSGESVDDRVLSHLETYYGWRLNRKLSLSSGVAFEFNQARLAGFNFDTQFFTMYGQAHYNLTDSKFRLYTYARAGYGFSAQEDFFIDDHSDGPQFQLGFGFKIPSRKRSKFHFALGWHFQQTSGSESFFDPFGNEVRTEFDLIISRPILKAVYEFN
jgi:hypothetical protein